MCTCIYVLYKYRTDITWGSSQWKHPDDHKTRSTVQAKLEAARPYQMAGAASAVSNSPRIAGEPAVLCFRLSITLSIPGSVQCDHVMNITMAVHKGASRPLVGQRHHVTSRSHLHKHD